MFHHRGASGWKPILIYEHAASPPARWLPDDVLVSYGSPEKSLHPWQQNLGDFIWLVERFSNPGDLVIDPLMGTGTTAEACFRTGRRFIGCDSESDAVELARRRLGDVGA
jgi:site-specific DNA-methyltransferase (adenine-specific)